MVIPKNSIYVQMVGSLDVIESYLFSLQLNKILINRSCRTFDIRFYLLLKKSHHELSNNMLSQEVFKITLNTAISYSTSIILDCSN